ncbi:hypothetical protein GCM10028824_20380 [Hymenobacter segetis]
MGQTLYTFNGGGTTGDWDAAYSWTTDPTGSTSINARVPAANDNVVITNSFVLSVKNLVAATGLNVTVQKGGVLDLTTATNNLPALASLSGQGTLRIAGPYFPTVTTNNFDDANTGTVEFYNWAAGPTALPIPVSGLYNNLRLLNTTATAYSTYLDANLTVNGNLTLLRSNATAFPSGNDNATAAAAAAAAGISLRIGNAAANRALSVYGDITIGGGTFLGVGSANNGTHTLTAYGSFINNGTVNLHNGTADDNQVATLVFSGATGATFACNGDTDLDILKVDKGIDSQVLLNVTSAQGLHGNAQGNLRLGHVGANVDLLVLVNGITKLGNNVYLAKISNVTTTGTGFSLGSSSTSPTLWIAGATVINNYANAFIVYGTYRISGGSLTSVNYDAMVVREDGQLLIEGGTTTVDKFRPSSTSSSHRGSFIISGGTFEAVGTYVGSVYVAQARFSIPYLTQGFRMTGGTIRVSNPANSTGAFHIGVDPNNASVSGGLIEIILPNTNTNAPILSTAPLWNLTIRKPTAGGTSKALLANITSEYTTGATNNAQPITVLNNFTLDATNPTTFDAANLDVNIQGTLAIGTGCTYLPGTNTTTFSGPQNQLLTNNGTIGATAGIGTFNNWTVNKSAGTLTLGGTVTTYRVPATATLSLLKGVLNDGTKTINVLGNMVNSAAHTSAGGSGSIVLNGTTNQIVSGDGNGVFGNLKINNSAATGTVAVTFTANMSVASTLTMLSTNILAIGSNRLALTNVESSGQTGALALGPGNAFSTSCFIQTAGNQSDLGLQKTYGKGDSFTFPVGTGLGTTARYAPAVIELRLASSAPLDKFGRVSVSPVSSRNPFVTGTTNSLAYYWKVRSAGFGPIPAGSIYEQFTMTNTDAPGTRANYVPARYLPIAWTKYTTNDMSIGSSLSYINFSAIDQVDGEFTAGEPAAFGTVTAFYSRGSGNWETPATWSTSSFSGAAATTVPGAGNPVFIGSAADGANHTVTVTANNAKAGSLVIDNGSTLDAQAFTGLNFGALPDSKPGGSGLLRMASTTTRTGANKKNDPYVYTTTTTFPGGDFGSFLQAGGGTVEYYTTTTAYAADPYNQAVTLPTTSSTGLALTSYNNLSLNALPNTSVTLPDADLRIYSQLKAGTAAAYTGDAYLSGTANGDLRIGTLLGVQTGALHFSNGNARNLLIEGDIQVSSGATFDTNGSGAAVANTLLVSGSTTNNGTLNFNTGGKTAALTFTGGQPASITGPTANTTNLYSLTVNKGIGRTATLNLDVAGTLTTPTSNWLTLTNGTLRYAKNSGTQPLTIHNAASPYLITDNAGLTVDAPNAAVTVATNTSAAADLKMAGQVQVLQGSLSVGSTAGTGNDLEYASAGTPTLKVSGTATLYVNGQIRRTVTNLDGALRFEQTGGTIDIDGKGATAAQSNERGLFEVQGKGSIFRMSGGTMNLHRSNGRPTIAADLYLAPDSTVVTGGTVVLGNTAAGAGNVTVSVSSTVPLYDLRVETGANNTNTNTGLLTGVLPLTLKGSLTIGNDNSFFNANSLGLNIYQSLINNNTSASTALNAGGFQPISTTQTTTFLGGIATQLLTGTASNLTVFGGLVLNTPQTNGKLQLGGNVLTAGTLTLTKGTLDDNGKTLTALGDVLNSATHTSTGAGSIVLAGTANQNIGGNGAGRFGNLTLNNAAGATATANQEITQVLALNNGVFTIGSNLLWLSNPAAGAVTGFSAARFIRTNGIVADLGLRKSYPASALNFTFPVGAAAKYTPVQMNLTANAVAGTITVQPIALAHPSTTNPLARELNYYWKVSSTGLSASPTVTQQFTYIDNGAGNDVNGTETSYKLGRFLNGAWNPINGISGSVVDATANTLTNTGVNYISGDYTGGEISEFGAVPTYYSRNATAGLAAGAAWDLASSWTFNADGTDSGPLPTSFPTLANPVVINSGHLINSNGPGRGAATLQLLGTLDLAANAANNFNTVTGTGTLRIGSALFPAGNYSNFVAPNTGTVDFTGAVQLPARDTYNNLTLSGGNAKQFTNLDLTINGTLNVAAGTTVDNPTSQNIALASATSGATVAGTLNLNDGQLTTGAALTTTSTGTVNLGAGAVTLGTALTNNGSLVLGNGNFKTGTSLTNGGTFDATKGAGAITVGTSFSNSGTYLAGTGNLDVNTTFTNTAAGNFSAATGEVNATGSFTNAGYYAATATNLLHANADFSIPAGGYFSAGTSTLVLRGNFTNAGTFDQGTSLAQFLTDVNHYITGNTTFWDLQKFGGNTLVMGSNTNVTVADLLTLQNGLFYTGPAGSSNTLSLTNTATQPIIGNTLSSYVSGRLAMTLPNDAASIRVFPVGAGGRYRPVTIKPLGVSSSPVVLVEIINGAPAGSVDGTLSNLSANRYYRIQLLSGTITQPTVQLSFNTDVVDETVNVPGNLRVARSAGASGPWSTAGGAGVYSPDAPRGYTVSAANQTVINNNSFFALASTNSVDNPLTGSAPLPVELVQFTATLKGAAVHLDWATASEKNSAYFAVERSADGQRFNEIGRVVAQGSTTLHHDYALVDAAPLTGLSYYRLRQVDNDGTLAYSPVATVRYAPENAAPVLQAYPNPATHAGFQLAITGLTGSTGSTVQVFDNVGRLVLTQAVAPNTMQTAIQPARPLATGMYFVTWTTEGAKLTTKVVVE